jgi:hypothetical protein
MRFVMNAMMVMTRMVFIAPGVPRAAGLCRRKRSGENDHSERNFQVHDFSFLILQRVYLNPGQTKRCPRCLFPSEPLRELDQFDTTATPGTIASRSAGR